MSVRSHRIIAVALAACFAGAAGAAQPEAQPAQESPQKLAFLPVVVASFVGTGIFDAFSTWVTSRSQPSPVAGVVSTGPMIQIPIAPATSVPVSNYVTQAPQAIWAPTQTYAPAPMGSAPLSPAYVDALIIIGKPDVPFTASEGRFDPRQPWNRTNNYQGILISVVVLNANNQPTEVRPLSAPFRTGERFRLRLSTTFDALTSLDAYRAAPGAAVAYALPNTQYALGNSQWAGQIYPARADQVVSLRAGSPVDLPLGANEYFVFDQNTGVERLVLNVRDAHAQAGQLSAQPVYRQDGARGSSYVQLTPAGQFPALSQMISLQHQR